ncbi:MAG: hypothetical protein GX660_22670, partial [Clostridiaceae bacterium]|nr:hypothetical protein [Clostridiaceae bacterium]
IGAEFEKLPSSVEKGKKVQVGILIKSTFNKDLTGAEAPLFNWEIIKKTTNEPVAPVTYMGHLDKASGTLDIPANTERLL